MKSCQVATQLFKMVAGWNAQVLICRRIVDHLELPKETPLKIGRDVSRPNVLDEEGAEPIISKTRNQANNPITYQCTTLWYMTANQLLPAAGKVAFLAIQLRLKILDPLVGQTREAYCDDHRVDSAADRSHGLKLALLVAKPQPRLLSNLETCLASVGDLGPQLIVDDVQLLIRLAQIGTGLRVQLHLTLR
jgi:hypothetical protein